jgi:hypothetical protein
MAETSWMDEYALLCESCGYSIDDLDQSLPCPECGKPILESLPHLKAGSPWQKRHAFLNLIKTWFLTLARPRYLFRQLNINQDSGIFLLLVGLFVAYLIPVVVVISVYTILLIKEGSNGDIFPFVIMAIIIAIVCWIVSVIYGALGVIRLRYFARRRGYRLTAPSQWTIVGHASMGLTILPILITITIAIILTMVAFEVDASSNTAKKLQLLSGFILVFSIPLAIIIFELLLHIGSRNLRNRNIFSESDLDSKPLQDEDKVPSSDISTQRGLD